MPSLYCPYDHSLTPCRFPDCDCSPPVAWRFIKNPDGRLNIEISIGVLQKRVDGFYSCKTPKETREFADKYRIINIKETEDRLKELKLELSKFISKNS